MIYILLLLVAVSSDSDIYMLEKGATLKELNVKSILIHCLIFGCINAFMGLIGLNVGKLILNENLILFHEVLTIIAFLCISALIFVKTFRRKEFIEHRGEGFKYKDSIKQSFYTGIDTFLVGIGISSMGYSFLMVCTLILITNIFSSISAICIGYYMGANFQKVFGYANALVYFIVANVELVMLFL